MVEGLGNALLVELSRYFANPGGAERTGPGALALRVGGLVRRGRAFRRTTGQTLMRLLSGTDLLLKEIAFRLGFPSQSGFSIAFRRVTGATPLQFRQEFRRAQMTIRSERPARRRL